MKYHDYYAILGIDRDAGADVVRCAYLRRAHRSHPDLVHEPTADGSFELLAEAYAALKDPEARAAYDELPPQRHGSEFVPPPDWSSRFIEPDFATANLEFADLFAEISERRWRSVRAPRRGQDRDVTVRISLEDAHRGTDVAVPVTFIEYDTAGRRRRVSRILNVRVPPGATPGRVLLFAGHGGKGFADGPDGDLYVHVALQPHALFRVSGYDLYLDLPLTPWEAVLGIDLDVALPSGAMRLKVPPGVRAGQRLHVPKSGLPKPDGAQGDVFVLIQIVLPVVVSEQESQMLQELAAGSTFDPRAHLGQELTHEARLS